MFVPNVFSFATEGKAFRYGSIRMPLELWTPWREYVEHVERVVADIVKHYQEKVEPNGFKAQIVTFDREAGVLLQTICPVNRPCPGKCHGLIVDYRGVFDDVATALDFDERSVQKVIAHLDELRQQLDEAVAAFLAFFTKCGPHGRWV